MRVSKKHDVRLNEILDAAEALFARKGYDQTTVNDILDRVEIGKGTF
jgi:AcrR family transcriptional regulator